MLLVWPAVGVHRMRTQQVRHRTGQHNQKTLFPVSLSRVNATSAFKVAASLGRRCSVGSDFFFHPVPIAFWLLDHPATFGLPLAVCGVFALGCMKTSPAKLELEEVDPWGYEVENHVEWNIVVDVLQLQPRDLARKMILP